MTSEERNSLEEYSRGIIRPLALALGLLYIGFSAAHFFLFSSSIQNVLFPLAFFTTTLYFGVYFFSHTILRHIRPTYIIATLCWMILLKSALQIVLTNDIQQTVSLMLILFCLSSVTFSFPVFAATCSLVWMVFGVSFFQTPNVDQKMHFLLTLAATSTLSYIVLSLRTQTYRELIALSSEQRRIKSMEVLSGGIVNELTTPLATLTASAGMAADELRKNPANINIALKRLDLVTTTISRMSKLMHQLRLFAGERMVAPEERQIDVRFTIQAAAKILGSSIKEADVKLTLDFPHEPMNVRGENSNLLMVFNDLIRNSLDAIRNLPDRWIIISARDTGDSVVVTITDSGKGIEPSVQTKMFDPLFSTKKGIRIGEGFGLAIARSVLKVHGAKISYDERRPNTTFILEFERWQLQQVNEKTAA